MFLFSIYSRCTRQTDARRQSDRRQTKASLNASALTGRGHNKTKKKHRKWKEFGSIESGRHRLASQSGNRLSRRSDGDVSDGVSVSGCPRHQVGGRCYVENYSSYNVAATRARLECQRADSDVRLHCPYIPTPLTVDHTRR